MQRNTKYLYAPDTTFVPAKLNLGAHFVNCLKKYGDKLALTNAVTGENNTYDEILQTSMNIAVSLVKMGLKKGEVVGICAENIQEIWPTVIGITCTGGVMTPFSIGFIKDELRHVMNISKPKYLFCSMQAYEKHKEVFTSLDFIEKIIMFGDQRVNESLLYKDLATATPKSFITSNVRFEEFEAVDVDGQSDTVFLLYSSGTTGLPKGVMQTHLNVVTVMCLPGLVDPKLRVLNISPWYHVYGLISGLMYFCHGMETVYIPKFEMDLYLRCIEEYKTSYLLLVPPLVMALIKASDKYDLNSVVTMQSGTAVLEPKIIDAVRAKFKNLQAIIQGYGLTETTYTVTFDTYYRNQICNPASVGKAVADTVIKISDIATRESLGPNERGEVCIKGTMVFKGYVGEGKKSDIDEEGFLKSGDLGYYDRDGYLYIVDRLKELIKYKGYQVPPAEIEAVLLQHPGVQDAGVVGLPEEIAGELPMAFVVLQEGANLTEAELKQYVAERLSNPKHLRGGVQFISEIPKTVSGKIQRKYLREILKKQKNGDNVA